MAAALKRVGIDVILGIDLDRRGFDAKLREFSRAIADADAGILYYAGHGLQVGLRNYLVPTDAQLQGERDLEFETVALDFVMRQMEIGREGKTNIVFLDAAKEDEALIAEGEEVSRVGRSGVTRVTVRTEDGRPIAEFTGYSRTIGGPIVEV